MAQSGYPAGGDGRADGRLSFEDRPRILKRAGLPSLNEGQTVEYEIVSNRGKESADNLKVR